jgi:DNA helicase-2/ATP-dependent DNA helicase PcrA
MTRAKEELVMLTASRRLLYGGLQHNPPSRFLSDIGSEASIVASEPRPAMNYEPEVVSEQLPQVSVGDRVRHQLFGVGMIENLDGSVATINFARGSKKLNLAFAPLEKL